MKFNPKKIFEKLHEYKRILAIAKKPEKEDLMFMLKISAIGVAILGVLGFVIYTLASLFLV